MPDPTVTQVTETPPIQEVEAVVIIPAERLPAFKEEDLAEEAIRRVLGYKGAIMAAPDDKAGYNKIVGFHKDGKNVLSKIKSACKKGREPARKEQQDWIAFENELVAQIEPILDDLEKQRKIYEAAEAKRKAEEQQKALQKVQARLDSLSAIGRRADYAKASTLTDEEWEVYFLSEKAEWEKEVAQREAAEQKRQTGELRKAELAGFNVPVVASDVAELAEDDYQRILADAKKAFEAAEEEKRQADERKRLMDVRYAQRVALLSQIGIQMEASDVETVRTMSDEDWTAYYADEKDAYDERQREAAETARLDAQLRDRLQAMAGFVSRPITPEESAQIRILAPEAWDTFLAKVKAAHEQKLADEEKERQKDALQRERMTALMPFGIMVNTELATRLREMPSEEWDTYHTEQKDAFDKRMAELAKLEKPKVLVVDSVLPPQGIQVTKSSPGPFVTSVVQTEQKSVLEGAWAPVKFEEANVQHLLDPAAPTSTSTKDDLDLVQEWVDLLDKAARMAPKHPDPNIQAGIDCIQKAILGALNSYWYTSSEEEKS